MAAYDTVTLTITATEGFNIVVSVTDPDGQPVTLGEVGILSDLADGVYNVQVDVTNEGYYGAKVFTLEVLPAIDFRLNGTWADSYKVGDTLTIFDMSLYNSVTQEVLVEKMNYTVKYYGADITVNEDKFVITGGGRYVIEYSATYGDIEYKKTVEIMVDRADPAAGEVESFGDASIVDHITMSYSSAPEYVTDLTQDPVDATHGFVKFAIEQQDSDTWPSLMFTPRLEKSAYAEYDYIAMTVKVVGTVESVVFNFYLENQEKQAVTVGEWVTIKLEADMFCKFGYDSAKAGLFWFGNWGGKDIQEFYIYEIKAIYDDEVPTEVGALVVFDSEDKLENISTLETSEIVFYDADKIAAAGGSVPALDGNDTGYVAINNVASNEWFNIKITPECNYAEFSQYDLSQIKLYISGGEGTVPIYYFNNKMKELPRGEWITFNMPVEIYKETLHVNKKLYTARQMFNQLSIDAFIMLVKPEAYTVYISSITLATPPTDDTLGNNFTKLTTDNIRVSSESVEQGTFFGKENAIKITSTDPWANIFVKPGKTYEELSAYSKLKMTLYVEAPAQIELYSQIRLYGAAANDFYSYGTIQPGAWITIEIDMARIMDLYAGLYLSNNPFMIVRGNDFTSITIAEMICE